MKYIINLEFSAIASKNILAKSSNYEELKEEADFKMEELKKKLNDLGFNVVIGWNYQEISDD